MKNTLPGHVFRILEQARWAPSGDNTQPWRFEVLGDDHILVHAFDTRDHVVYDLDGHASQLAVGAMLETLAIAASAEGYTVNMDRRRESPDTHMLVDVRLETAPGLRPDVLNPYIETRVVQRRRMSTEPLSEEEKKMLSDALPSGYEVVWFEELGDRWRFARLLYDSAKIRLTIPEAYRVHKSVIEWGAQFSPDKIPDQAIGIDPLTLRLMRWAMQSWRRIEFLNKYLFGHVLPRIEMDLLPALRCGAHFMLLAPRAPTRSADYLEAGRALQRFWLTLTRLGWLAQPETTPMIFGRYSRQGVSFTSVKSALDKAHEVGRRLEELADPGRIERIFFMGRVGRAPSPLARSTRKTVAGLQAYPADDSAKGFKA